MLPHRLKNSLSAVLVILILAAIAAVMILAATPPVSRDALTHHLAIPKLYLTEGAIREFPDIVFSYYPMNLDILYCLPLYFGNDILPKYIHFAFGLITAWGIGLYLKQRFSLVYGLLAALLFLTLPVIAKLSTTVYVDLGLCCFSFFALRFVIKWWASGFQHRYVIWAGLMCGLALGTKYNALVVLLLLALLVLWLRVRRPRVGSHDRLHAELDSHPRAGPIAPAAVSVLLFVSVAILAFAPWMIRNAIWTGNPIYPLYDEMFSAIDPQDDSFRGERLATPANKRLPPLVHRRLVYGEPFWYTALIPFRIFFEGQDDNPQYFDGKLNPILLFLSLVVFLPLQKNERRRNPEDYIWLGFAVLLIAFTFFTAPMRIRYIVAAVPPLVILSVAGVHRLLACPQRSENTNTLPSIIKGISIIAIVATLAYNTYYMNTLYQRYTPVDYLRGELDREAYIQKHRPEYALFRYANLNLSASNKILGVFIGNRRYYIDIPIDMKETLIMQAVENAKGSDEIAVFLSRQGFTHLIMHRDIFDFWIKNNIDEKGIKILRDFINSKLVELSRSEEYSLFEIVSE